MVAREDEVAEVARWSEGIERIHERIGGRFRRPEPRRRALDYLKGLLSLVERKNGGSLLSRRGTPHRTGCNACCPATGGTPTWFATIWLVTLWSTWATLTAYWWWTRPGSSRKGNKSAGVQRQYSGTAGRIENCQIGVFLAYACSKGRALLDRELYLPQVWAGDVERRREAGVPRDAVFRTKPQLARRMLERALESGVPFGWVTGDEVYGSDRNLRLWLEQEGIPHVLAIKSNEKLWVWTEKGPQQVRADRLAAQVEVTDWVRCSAGDGAKGPRLYDWATVEIRPLREPGRGYWLLARRSIAKPDELAYYVCFGPSGTAMAELVRVAGRRWAIEECFEEAKGQSLPSRRRGWDWTSTRYAVGMPGIAISPWRCWPTPIWR